MTLHPIQTVNVLLSPTNLYFIRNALNPRSLYPEKRGSKSSRNFKIFNRFKNEENVIQLSKLDPRFKNGFFFFKIKVRSGN